MQHHIDFERLVTNISTKFINMASDEINKGINEALKAIGEFEEVDRSYIFQFSEDLATMDNTHEWCAAGIEPQIDNRQKVEVESLPWFAEKIIKQQVFQALRVADFPPEASAEKELLEKQEIQSIICVPLIYQGSLVGFMGFDAVRQVKTWPDDAISLLRIVGEIFFNALARKRAESERETTIELLGLLNARNNLHELIRTILCFMKELSGCEAVGIRLRDGDDFPYYETSGFSDEFVEAERYLCVRDLNGQLKRDEIGNPVLKCMCGNVICGRFDPSKPFFTDHGSFVSNCTSELLASTTEEDRQSCTRNRCNGEGYESVALIPLCAGGETFGLIQFNDRRKRSFSHQFIALAEHLADNVAIALAQRKAEKTLWESEAKFRDLAELLPEIVYETDLNGNFTYVNRVAFERFGYSKEDFEKGINL
ncbi:MAG: GAF domain-containing protein [Deltaproteobacteria bacterium]|nr:GAF domain-containing protein [Deltaproteobacteria bacterium]